MRGLISSVLKGKLRCGNLRSFPGSSSHPSAPLTASAAALATLRESPFLRDGSETRPHGVDAMHFILFFYYFENSSSQNRPADLHKAQISGESVQSLSFQGQSVTPYPWKSCPGSETLPQCGYPRSSLASNSHPYARDKFVPLILLSQCPPQRPPPLPPPPHPPSPAMAIHRPLLSSPEEDPEPRRHLHALPPSAEPEAGRETAAGSCCPAGRAGELPRGPGRARRSGRLSARRAAPSPALLCSPPGLTGEGAGKRREGKRGRRPRLLLRLLLLLSPGPGPAHGDAGHIRASPPSPPPPAAAAALSAQPDSISASPPPVSLPRPRGRGSPGQGSAEPAERPGTCPTKGPGGTGPSSCD